ncbi:Xyloglucan endotransglucosylase/hydrolase protein 2, putative [Theobroma cacao]|uniref:Xyloglucan endotransglucosylase/hydrolase protein 2, putative n=1 Tax=Theobroma cacao TaxID=3641 RepID=A0A061DMG6_THECC|nr:Xyloglucan endotransglucosylase/hydrolase protein 2, putative [Theobroma cacao]
MEKRFFFALLLTAVVNASRANDVSFDQNYHITWGNSHVTSLNEGREIHISMDNVSGAGFQSNARYASGFFQMKLKIPNKDSAGVVTAFYLIDNKGEGDHDELDFEFLGSKGQPCTLQTNVFANDKGGREQRYHLWFDPTADFHTYGILWNQHQIVFYVDNTPIRVSKNISNIGVNYPSQTLVIQASIWDGEGWASNGRKLDWSQQPFTASFQGFNVDGCQSLENSNKEQCYDSSLWWNGNTYWGLDPAKQKALEDARAEYMFEDYCSSKEGKYGHKECQINTFFY